MNFNEFAVVGQFLEVATDGVFRDVEFLAQAGGQDLIVEIDLM